MSGNVIFAPQKFFELVIFGFAGYSPVTVAGNFFGISSGREIIHALFPAELLKYLLDLGVSRVVGVIEFRFAAYFAEYFGKFLSGIFSGGVIAGRLLELFVEAVSGVSDIETLGGKGKII